MGIENFEEVQIPSPEENSLEVGKSVSFKGKPGYIVLGHLPEQGKVLILEHGEGLPIEASEEDLSPDTGVARIDLLNDAEVYSDLHEKDKAEIAKRTAERKRQIGNQDQIAA